MTYRYIRYRTLFRSLLLSIVSALTGASIPEPIAPETTLKKVVVFDLGYTLIQPSRSSLQSEIGVGDYLLYTIFDGKDSDDLQNSVFDLLTRLGGAQETETPILTHTGIPMPTVLVEWQSGTRDGAALLTEAHALADTLNDTSHFVSAQEYRLVKNALRIMLDETILANSMKPIKKGVKLLKELVDAGVEVYILSNWDAHSFAALTQSDRCSEIFSMIPESHRTVSGKCGTLKPRPDMYTQFCTQHNLIPEQCIFIDDQPENCEAARAHGMTALHIDRKKKNYKEIRETLTELAVLPE